MQACEIICFFLFSKIIQEGLHLLAITLLLSIIIEGVKSLSGYNRIVSQDLRGVYFDLQKEAPGPLLFNTDELVEAIKNIDNFKNDYADKIAFFKDKYLTYECGNSCEQIYNKVFVEHYQCNDFILGKYYKFQMIRKSLFSKFRRVLHLFLKR